MKTFKQFYNQIREEKLSDVKVRPGALKKALGIPEEDTLSMHYTSGKKLAQDLVDRVGPKKAHGMLAYAANINSRNDIFDIALRNLPEITEEFDAAAAERGIRARDASIKNALHSDNQDIKKIAKVKDDVLEIDKKILNLKKTKDQLKKKEQQLQKQKTKSNDINDTPDQSDPSDL